jgi:hypothetical protein
VIFRAIPVFPEKFPFFLFSIFFQEFTIFHQNFTKNRQNRAVDAFRRMLAAKRCGIPLQRGLLFSAHDAEEGFHSVLRQAFGGRHPPLGEFIACLQTMPPSSYDHRIRMLREGVDFPKNRREVDIWMDQEILHEKNLLLTMTHNQPLTYDNVLEFCHRISDLIGNHDGTD